MKVIQEYDVFECELRKGMSKTERLRLINQLCKRFFDY